MTLTLILVLVSAAALLFVLKPLFAKQVIPFDLTDEQTRQLEQLIRRKNKIYSDIKDLDFEFGIGKMADDDYQSLRKECVREVADILRQIDGQKKLSDGNGKISNEYLERLIASKRKTKSNAVTIDMHPEILACPDCGFENILNAKFCSECGAKLTKEG
jgi:hypothetical protein